MKLPVIEARPAVWIYMYCLWVVRTTHAHPYPKPGSHDLATCGSDTCDTQKRPTPEFCNKVETRCESCTVRTCEEVICGAWNGCSNTTPPTVIAITAGVPVSEIHHDEVTKSNSESDRRETEMLQQSVDKLRATVDDLVYRFYGLCVLVAILTILAILAVFRPKLLCPRCNPRPRPGGNSQAPYRGDSDQTIPMIVYHSADSGIQEPEQDSTQFHTTPVPHNHRLPQQPASSGQMSRVANNEESVSRDVPIYPLGVTESQYNGKPTTMAL